MIEANVLIVEDEYVIAAGLKQNLENMGCNVIALISTGEDALRFIEKELPDLVLMDIKLRGEMDGVDTAEIIKDKWKIPVIYLTAHSDDSLLQRAKLTEPWGYLVKPFDVKSLKAHIETSLFKAGLEKKLIETEARCRGIFDRTSSGIAVYKAVNDGDDFVFVDFNPAGEKIENVSRDELIGKSVVECFPAITEFGLLEVFREVWKTGAPRQHPVTFYKDDRIAGWRENYVFKLPSGEIVAVYEDITERKQSEEHKEKMIAELQDALAKVKLLSGMLPICANCKKIRDDKGYWKQIEGYIRDHSEAEFTHGLCPDCAESALKELEEQGFVIKR